MQPIFWAYLVHAPPALGCLSPNSRRKLTERELTVILVSIFVLSVLERISKNQFNIRTYSAVGQHLEIIPFWGLSTIVLPILNNDSICLESKNQGMKMKYDLRARSACTSRVSIGGWFAGRVK